MPPLKYPWNASQDAILRAAYAVGTDRRRLKAALTDAQRRIGYPRHMLRLRAQRLGLSNDTRRPWTPAEIALLEEKRGEWSVKRLARHLGRAVSTVAAQMERHQFSRRVIGGYSIQDVAHLLGVSPETVMRWEANGLLRRMDGRITERSVQQLVFKHPELYSLRRVDEKLFKGLVFADAEVFRAPVTRRWAESVQTFAAEEATA